MRNCDWEQRKLGEVFDVHTDFVANGSFKSLKENVKYFNTENYAYMIRLQDASNNWSGPWLYTDKQGYDFLKKSSLNPGDILMSDRGTIGKFFQVPKLDRPMTLSSNAVLLRSSKHDNSFLFVLMSSNQVANDIKVKTTPGVQPMISKTAFKTIITKLPSSDEQKKIGELFSVLDSTIALHQRKLTLLKQLKQTYLKQIFPQNKENIPALRFAGFSEPWEQRKFSNIVNRVSQQSNDSNLPKVEFEDIISGEGRLNKDISRKFDSRKGTVFEPEFILYGKLRPYLKNWLFPSFKGIALGDFWVFEPNNSSSIFDYYLIQSDKYQAVANLSSGTKMPRSDWKTVSETVFSIPDSINEQEKIGAFFNQLDNAIALHQEKIAHLKALKSILLNKMFI